MSTYTQLLKDIDEAQANACQLKRQLDSLNVREINVTIENENVFIQTEDCLQNDVTITLKTPLPKELQFSIINLLLEISNYCQECYVSVEPGRTKVALPARSSSYPGIVSFINNSVKEHMKHV